MGMGLCGVVLGWLALSVVGVRLLIGGRAQRSCRGLAQTPGREAPGGTPRGTAAPCWLCRARSGGSSVPTLLSVRLGGSCSTPSPVLWLRSPGYRSLLPVAGPAARTYGFPAAPFSRDARGVANPRGVTATPANHARGLLVRTAAD